MKSLVPYRHLLAPAAGAAMIIAAALGFDVPLTAAIVAGALTWLAAHLLLQPQSVWARLAGRRALPYDPATMEAELDRARRRVADIGRHAAAIEDKGIRRALESIAGSARLIMDEVVKDPRDYPKMRKALVHHLDSVAVVADGLAAMKMRALSADSVGRTRTTLTGLADEFERYHARIFENEAFEVETRIAMLEQELRQSAPLASEPRDIP